MKHRHSTAALAAIGMMVLILDTKCALNSAEEGITLCIRTVIPSLFPFIFLSKILSNVFAGSHFSFLRPLGRLCGMPEGSETLFLVGLLGGYPTGAACIAENYRQGQLSKEQAEHLLGFCSNAGPAFLFGMAGSLFSAPYIPWLLWAIHILSALLSAVFIPRCSGKEVTLRQAVDCKLQTVFQQTLRVMASICGWVVLFRILIGFCERWFLWCLSPEAQCVIAGFLELSNGCYSLAGVTSDAPRFIILSCVLAFGGICVMMQTASVAAGLSLRWYLAGKLLQTMFSLLLSIAVIPILFENIHDFSPAEAIALLLIVLVIPAFASILKKTVAFPSALLYNREKYLKR